MSGGHYDYRYHWLRDLADDIECSLREDREHQCGGHNGPLREHLINLLRAVATACHDVEWVDSGDYAPGDENEAIVKVHGPVACARCGGELEAKVNPDGVFIVHPCRTDHEALKKFRGPV